MNLSTRKIVFTLGLLAFLVLVGGGLFLRQTKLTKESPTARLAQADLLGLTAEERLRYAPEVEGETEDEGEELLGMTDYWATRYTYPTGQFNQQWLADAAEQAKQVEGGVPDGLYATGNGRYPLNIGTSQFTSLGPKPLQSNGCQGCFQYGLVSGRVQIIVTDPVSPTIAYFGSAGGGVWKTTNCCDVNTTWSPMTDDPSLYGLSINDLTLDPNNHNIIYAGTGDLNFGSFSMGTVGVLKSVDQGSTWDILGTDVFTAGYPIDLTFPQYQAIGKIRVDPRNSNIVIAGTKTGLYFSYDGGQTWSDPCFTNSFLDQRQDITGLLVSDNGTSTDLYAAIGPRGFNTTVQPNLNLNGANAVYKTTVPASGCPASWSLLNNGWPTGTGGGAPYPANTIGRIELAMAPSDPNTIYAQVADIPNNGGHLGVWKTTNGGTSWVQASGPTGPGGCSGPGTQSWYNQIIAVHPTDPTMVFMGAIDSFRSTNGATSFTNLSCGYNGGNDLHVDQHALAFANDVNHTLLLGSDGGIYFSPNATASDPNAVVFQQLNESVSTIEFYSGDITQNFATSASPGINAGAQDNGSSVYVWTNGTPGPATWQLQRGGDGMYARIEPLQGLRWYQESQNGNLYASTTGAYGTFNSITGGWTGDAARSFVFPYEIDKYDCDGATTCNHLIAGSYRVWETVTGGLGGNWYINSPNLTKSTLGNRSFINQLSYSWTDNKIAIVGTNDGNVYYGFNLGLGTANSATWVNVTDNNAILPNRPILDVATDPFNPLVGYAAVGGFDANTPSTPGHIFQVTCTANCASFTWSDKTGNLPNIPVDSIIANPNYPGQVFAGTDWGLYYTNDITAVTPVWHSFTAGLPRVMIWDMAIDRGFTTLAVFTRSRGAFVWPLPLTYFATLDNTTVNGGPSTTVNHYMTLTNRGLDDSFNLAVEAGDWPATLVGPSTVSVDASASTIVTISVDIPLTATINQMDSFTVTATSVTSPTHVYQGLGTTKAAGTVGATTSGNATGSGLRGTVITYPVWVKNTGNVIDTFNVTLGTSNWNTTASVASVGPLAPQETGYVDVMVLVGPTGLSDMVSVSFRSVFNTNLVRSLNLTSSALAAGVVASPDMAGSALAGETITYTVWVTNTGDLSDTYALDLSATNWAVSSPATIGPLDAGQSGSFDVTVVVGSGLADTAVVTVTSGIDSGISDTVALNSSLLVVPDVTASQDMTMTGEIGSVVTYTVWVTNAGNITDSYAISLGTAVWTTTTSMTNTTDLAPGESAMVEVYVVVGQEASDTVAVTFTSNYVPALSFAGSATVQLTTYGPATPPVYWVYLPIGIKN